MGREHRLQLLRPHQRATSEMKPARRLALSIRVRPRLTEAQLTLGDDVTATTTLGAPCRRGLNRIRHDAHFHGERAATSSFTQALGAAARVSAEHPSAF